MPTPEFTVERVPIEKINPASYNPRRKLRRGDKEWEDIRASIERWGFVQNGIWNRRTGNLIAGHQRLAVCKKEFGWMDFPCCVVDLEDTEEKALNVAMNAIGEGLWDEGKLGDLIRDLKARLVDIDSLGFTTDRIDAILGTKPPKKKKDPDAEAPPPPKKPVTKAGDRYLFISPDGNPQHHLVCGDALDAAVVEALMAGARADLLFADPPYGVSYVSHAGTDKMAQREIQNDDLRDHALKEFLTRAFASAYSATTQEAPGIIWYASRTHRAFEDAIDKAGWRTKQQIVWAKQMVLGRSDYHWAHEPAFLVAKQDESTQWYGPRTETTVWDTSPDFSSMAKEELVRLLEGLKAGSTVWDIQRDPPSRYLHPNQKPTALARRAMQNHTRRGGNVLDIFGGSGSTLLAAELELRNAFLVEIEPAFCDVIVRRYLETFEGVAVQRNGKDVDPAEYNVSL
jgi:DNA modification methylase